jgi:hypothetical protein
MIYLNENINFIKWISYSHFMADKKYKNTKKKVEKGKYVLFWFKILYTDWWRDAKCLCPDLELAYQN